MGNSDGKLAKSTSGSLTSNESWKVTEQCEQNEQSNHDIEQVAQLTASNDEIVELKLLLEQAKCKLILSQLKIERLEGLLVVADNDSHKHESSKFRVEEKLAANKAKIAELQLSLEHTTQLSMKPRLD